MTVETMPEADIAARDDDPMVHTVCCNPLVALCGEDMGEDAEEVDDELPECVVCYELFGQPCGAFLCRFRQRWRGRRWP